MANVGIDLDGVAYPWQESLVDFLELYRGYNGTFNKFWTEDYKQLTDEEWSFLTSIEFLYTSAIPHKSVMEPLTRLAQRHEIFYITSRPKIVELATEQFLRKYDFPFSNNLIFTESKDKSARLLNIRIFIDDLPKNLLSLEKVCNVYMMLRPYNKEFRERFNTVANLEEFVAALETKN